MNAELAHGLLGQMSQRVPSKLIQFGQALDSAGYLVDGWPYFLEKAHKWSDEYTAWANHDYPQKDDALWDEFLAEVEGSD